MQELYGLKHDRVNKLIRQVRMDWKERRKELGRRMLWDEIEQALISVYEESRQVSDRQQALRALENLMYAYGARDKAREMAIKKIVEEIKTLTPDQLAEEAEAVLDRMKKQAGKISKIDAVPDPNRDG